jgi:hypothetical protein
VSGDNLSERVSVENLSEKVLLQICWQRERERESGKRAGDKVCLWAEILGRQLEERALGGSLVGESRSLRRQSGDSLGMEAEEGG